MRDSRIEERFLSFHRDNPDIYLTLARLARQAKASGRQKMGVKMLWEVMRWELIIQSTGSEGYKLNNDFPSRYARLIMEQEQDLSTFFELRRLRS
jgi:hypothetical protein